MSFFFFNLRGFCQELMTCTKHSVLEPKWRLGGVTSHPHPGPPSRSEPANEGMRVWRPCGQTLLLRDRSLTHCRGNVKPYSPSRKQFLIKLNMQLTCDPAIVPLGIYSGEIKTYVPQNPVHEIHNSFLCSPPNGNTQMSFNGVNG